LKALLPRAGLSLFEQASDQPKRAHLGLRRELSSSLYTVPRASNRFGDSGVTSLHQPRLIPAIAELE
jgi:hypothetical protein